MDIKSLQLLINGKVCGDWNYKDIEYKSDLEITPNPGGIGRLTTYELFKEILGEK